MPTGKYVAVQDFFALEPVLYTYVLNYLIHWAFERFDLYPEWVGVYRLQSV